MTIADDLAVVREGFHCFCNPKRHGTHIRSCPVTAAHAALERVEREYAASCERLTATRAERNDARARLAEAERVLRAIEDYDDASIAGLAVRAYLASREQEDR